MARFIITFGQIHYHRVNGHTFDKDSVAVIKAEDHQKARSIAFDLFGNKFCTSYDEEKFDTKGYIEYFPRGKMEAN